MMEIIKFEDKYLQQVIDIFNKSYPYYQIDKQMLETVVFNDENYDNELFLLVVEEQEVKGYVIGIYRKYPYLNRGLEEDRCWILDLSVRDNDYKVAQLLLEEIEKKLKNPNIYVGSYSPQYFFYGVDKENDFNRQLYLDNGYRLFENHYWMEKDLKDYKLDERIMTIKDDLQKEGIEFVSCQKEDQKELVKFVEENFTAGWLKNIKRLIDRDILEDHCILAKKDNKIIAYIQRSIDFDEQRFGPFGVDENYRGKKIGTVLLHEMFNQIYAFGYESCFFKSTEDNARRLYEREGMQVKHTFNLCHKKRGS